MEEDPFSGWGLRPVLATDQAALAPYFASLAEPLSDYTFSQVYTWRNSLRILWTVVHGHLCVFANGAGDLTLLMPPIGDGDSTRAMATAFEMMDDYNAAHGVPDRSRVEYASEELLARCGRAGLVVQPMGTDYVYDTARMIDLAGGDLSSKRQAKNRFLRNYAHRVEAYDPALHLEDCRRLLDTWKIHQDAQHLDECDTNALKRAKETVATDLTLTSAPELGLKGMVVYMRTDQVRGDPPVCDASIGDAIGDASAGDSSRAELAGGWSLRGFTFGEDLGRDQSSITIEKTDLEVKGLAQFIFSEFCRAHWSGRPLVNVGDDWGLETLAWTKMSYRPVKLLQKYTLKKAAAVKVAVPATTAPAIEAREMKTEAEAIAALVEVAVRPAIKDDLAAAVELEKACFSSYSLNKRQLQYLQQRRSAVFLVAEEGGQAVGEGIALVRQHRRGLSGRIYSLAVRPDRRGRKIGQRLLSAMTDELASRGVRRIYLEVEEHNLAAIRLYERSGFRHIGLLPDYYGPGKSARHMMCEVPVTAGLFDMVAGAVR